MRPLVQKYPLPFVSDLLTLVASHFMINGHILRIIQWSYPEDRQVVTSRGSSSGHIPRIVKWSHPEDRPVVITRGSSSGHNSRINQ
ncbi:hypothetical protein PoB_006096700 [Plakobranchus ocellatus]|uniref:Uncharacterized protein n=1 Tax=Plakobranchus ocellatus TaxID=259542 RepID=A0AAV4CRD9_9GAST|nr:hypothetical protein PoB_006096700 [Plakobranchus ocellatus]